MGKIFIEIGLISARELLVGTGFGSSLLKHQWYAVGWIDHEDKYCTTMHASRSDNALWRTKFIASLDDEEAYSKFQALFVEVYSKEPIFLRETRHGSATIPLKEFLAKYKNQSSSSSIFEKTGSYRLNNMNSSKPQGFVDVSVRISAERQDFGGSTGDFGGVMLSNNSGYMAGSLMPMSLTNNASPQMQQPYYPPPPMHQLYYPPPPMQQPYYPPPPMHQPYYPPPPIQQSYYPSPPMHQSYYPSAPMQPPSPPETWNASYMPTYMPRSEIDVNIPSSSSSEGAGRGYARTEPGLGAGTGFYDRDYMSRAEPDPKFSEPYTK